MKIESSEAAKAQFYINASAHRSEKAAAEEPSAAKQQYDRVDISHSASQETDFSHTLASRLVQEVRAANSTHSTGSQDRFRLCIIRPVLSARHEKRRAEGVGKPLPPYGKQTADAAPT